MPRIRCNYEGCIHLEGAVCTAGEIELDQELGCLTFSQVDEEIMDVDEDLEDAMGATTDEEWDEEDFEEDEDEDLEEWDEDEDLEDDEDEEEDGWSSSRRHR